MASSKKDAQVFFVRLADGSSPEDMAAAARRLWVKMEASRIVAKDALVGSYDPVAVDAAAIDLLNERHSRDVFRGFWPQYDPRVQIEHGERIGLGTSRYALVQVGG